MRGITGLYGVGEGVVGDAALRSTSRNVWYTWESDSTDYGDVGAGPDNVRWYPLLPYGSSSYPFIKVRNGSYVHIPIALEQSSAAPLPRGTVSVYLSSDNVLSSDDYKFPQTINLTNVQGRVELSMFTQIPSHIRGVKQLFIKLDENRYYPWPIKLHADQIFTREGNNTINLGYVDIY